MIIWDREKYIKLKSERNIDLIDIEQIIIKKKFIAILKNPSRPPQKLFIIDYKNYTHVVPFIIDEDKNIILKTVFASRKYHNIYGGSKK